MGEGEKSNKRPIVLIVVVVIILAALWILVPNIPKLLNFEDGNEDVQNKVDYDKFEGENTIVYKNEELNTSITSIYDDYWDYTVYEAEWVDKWGNSDSVSANSPENLYEEILKIQENLSTEQLEWYDYLCKKVVE